jgi:hypothetical protein
MKSRAMLTLAGDEGELEEIDPAHLPDVLESLAQAKRREFATDAGRKQTVEGVRNLVTRI